MSDIKRYDTFGEGEFMYPFEDGGYVRFDEHQSAIDRLTAERDEAMRERNILADILKYRKGKLTEDMYLAVAALEKIESLSMSMFKDPYEMIGECVNIACNALVEMKEQEQGK